jgi:hypothetical protein
MTCPTRRLIHFAGSTVGLECTGERTGRIADFLIPPSALVTDQPTHITLRMETDEATSPVTYCLFAGDQQIFRTENPGDLAEQTLSQVCHQLATESRPGLLLHAAALSDCSRGVIIPGGCGAGKSTLTAWLITHLGLVYLSDELVYFSPGSGTFDAFTRPLHLKRPSRPVLKPFFDLERLDEAQIISSSFSDMVAPRVFAPGPNPSAQFSPDLLFFPHYQPDCAPTWKELSPAEICFLLMQSLINARNLPGFGFDEAVRLSKLGRGYAFTYSHFDQIENRVRDVLGDRVESREWRVVKSEQ